MVNITDLRIGSLVVDKDGQEYYVVSLSNMGKVFCVIEGDEDDVHVFSADELESPQLDFNMLRRCGFQKEERTNTDGTIDYRYKLTVLSGLITFVSLWSNAKYTEVAIEGTEVKIYHLWELEALYPIFEGKPLSIRRF